MHSDKDNLNDVAAAERLAELHKHSTSGSEWKAIDFEEKECDAIKFYKKPGPYAVIDAIRDLEKQYPPEDFVLIQREYSTEVPESFTIQPYPRKK
jgi:hypothetical protein